MAGRVRREAEVRIQNTRNQNSGFRFLASARSRSEARLLLRPAALAGLGALIE
jgi:hypothetical protein